jgi:hypothetical protein
VALCPDVAPFTYNRFDCCDLLQRSVIHYGAERKASPAIISIPHSGRDVIDAHELEQRPSEKENSRNVLAKEAASRMKKQSGAFRPTRTRPNSRGTFAHDQQHNRSVDRNE